MNASNARDYLPLVQALADGKTVQLSDGKGGWIDGDIEFTYPASEYRIKPEPREIWVNEFPRNDMVAFESQDQAVKHARMYSLDSSPKRYREVIE